MRSRSVRLRLEALEARLVPTVYPVGPGEPFATLHQVPWDALEPGDTVAVHWKATPYHDKIQINRSGTAEAPIQVVGVPNDAGQLPVLDARNAVEDPEASYYSDYITAQGVFTIAPSVWNEKVDWVVIANLEIENASRDYSFRNAAGTTASWNWGAAAVAMYQAEHITIAGCVIHDNEDGLFGTSNEWESSILRDIRVVGNTIYGNGVAGQTHYHNTYIEAIGMNYEFNHFGPPVEGSGGLNVKDRSAGLVFRYNYVEGGNTLLDLVDPEDGGQAFLDDPLWGDTYVYGNVLYDPPGGAGAFVHFGGDSGVVWLYQRNLHFYDNTVVDRNDYPGGRWRTIIFYADTNDQTVFAYNNIFYNEPATAGFWPGNWCLGEVYGTFYLGTNWFNTGYANFRDGVPPEGVVYGTEWSITGDDPGFVDAADNDFRLSADSPCRGVADPLQGSDSSHPVRFQTNYDTGSWSHRPTTDNLGAME
jgi:hypothetical protein